MISRILAACLLLAAQAVIAQELEPQFGVMLNWYKWAAELTASADAT
jgi:hypothetical protein